VEALEQAVEGSADLSPALRGLEQPLQALEAAWDQRAERMRALH
jgi:hypothetical protein